MRQNQGPPSLWGNAGASLCSQRSLTCPRQHKALWPPIVRPAAALHAPLRTAADAGAQRNCFISTSGSSFRKLSLSPRTQKNTFILWNLQCGGICWWPSTTQDNRFWIFSRTLNVDKKSNLLSTADCKWCLFSGRSSLPKLSIQKLASLLNKSESSHICPTSPYLAWRNSRRHHHRSFSWWWSLIPENMARTYYAPFLALQHWLWDQSTPNAMSPKNRNFLLLEIFNFPIENKWDYIWRNLNKFTMNYYFICVFW